MPAIKNNAPQTIASSIVWPKSGCAINNAATIVVKRVHLVTAEEWDLVMGVNLTGVFYGIKHAIRQFQAQGMGGSIVNIGSISAVVAMPSQPGYCASKGGVFQRTRRE